MSGGHWNYSDFHIRELLDEIIRDEAVIARFPRLVERLTEIALVLPAIIHDLDYDISGDQSIKDDGRFERESIDKLDRLIVRRALEAVLLFYNGLPWDEKAQSEWLRLTGYSEASTRTLCDVIRRALGEKARVMATDSTSIRAGKIVLVKPDGTETITRCDTPPPLEEVQRLVDGYVECVTMAAQWNGELGQMYCNEEGKLKHLAQNLVATFLLRATNPHFEDILVGNIVVLVGKARWK